MKSPPKSHNSNSYIGTCSSLQRQHSSKTFKITNFQYGQVLQPMPVKKHLLDHAPSTDKGKMKRQLQGLRSTKEKVKEALETVKMDRDIHPPMEREEFNHLFGYAGRINPKYGKIYVDLTGKLILRSIEGTTTVLFYMTGRPMLFYPLLSPMKNMKQW